MLGPGSAGADVLLVATSPKADCVAFSAAGLTLDPILLASGDLSVEEGVSCSDLLLFVTAELG